MKRTLVATVVGLAVASGSASEQCRSGFGIQTPQGKLVSTRCTVDGVDRTHSLSLDGIKVLEDARLFSEETNKLRTLHVYKSGTYSAVTACAEKLYLLDTSRRPPLTIAFGVKNACNEFHWASWGDKRSVIALKKNVKFVYEDGKLLPPAKGEALWNAIEPPHSGPGLSIEDAIPFVEIVLPPK